MDIKTILIVIVLLVTGFYIAPFVDAIFSINTEYCEQFDVYGEDEYIVGYGERLRAVREGCY